MTYQYRPPTATVPTAPTEYAPAQGLGTEAAASVTYAVIDPNGFPLLLTERAVSVEALFDTLPQVSATLTGQGYVPDYRGRPGPALGLAPAQPPAPAQGQPSAPATGGGVKVVKGYPVTAPPACPVHGTPMSLKSNRTTGEEFWACAQPGLGGEKYCQGPRQLKPGPLA